MSYLLLKMAHLRGFNTPKNPRGPQGRGSRFPDPWGMKKYQSTIPQFPKEWKSLGIGIPSSIFLRPRKPFYLCTMLDLIFILIFITFFREPLLRAISPSKRNRIDRVRMGWKSDRIWGQSHLHLWSRKKIPRWFWTNKCWSHLQTWIHLGPACMGAMYWE